MGDNLKQRTIGALTWSVVDRVAQQSVQFIVGIIMARLLLPEDYGLMGIVMVFAAIAYTMVDGGLCSALVRTRDLSELHSNTVFYANLGISALMYALLFVCAPLIADFYGEPLITPIARVMFTAIIFNSFYLVPYALFGRAMDYKSMAKVNFVSVFVSGSAGVAMAYNGFGVWALVAQQLSYHFVRMLMFYAVSRWKPRLMFSFALLKEFWGFSLHLLSNNLIGVLFNNLYTFLIGKLYPIKQVGYYSQAYKMNDTVSFTFQSILSTAYNMFSQIIDQKERMARILGELIKKVSVISMPLMAFLIAGAGELFYVLYGDKWLPAVPYFRLLCASAIFLPMHQINIHALNALGLSKVTFRIELVKRGLILLSIALTYSYGITELLAGFVLSCYGGFAASLAYVRKHLGVPIATSLGHMLKGLLIAACVAAACIAVRLIIPCSVSPFIVFAVEALCSGAAYLLMMRLLCRDIMAEVYGWAKSKLRRKND